MVDVNDLMEAVRRHIESAGPECSVRLENSPLSAADADATIALRWGGSRQRFAVHVMERVRMERVLAARADRGGMVVAPWISTTMGRRLSEAGVAWADSVGNMAIRFGMVLLEVSGRPRPAAPAQVGPPVRSVSLLTPANARVIEALIADPSVRDGSLRALAAVAEVSVGQAHKASTLLASAGFHRDRLGPDQIEALARLVQVGSAPLGWD
ncbi:hypothetical protein [Nocardioides sp.]|uniref:hypothetical protein n=1 Tax=Nocardioides sp. TaxID=35761 RepID=UPI00263215D8|nr:hypothetical protein [Nocardioides sp.]